MLAMICASALASAESAASRAVCVSVAVRTEPCSRPLMARNAMAMTSVTESKISVRMSAMPSHLRFAICDLRFVKQLAIGNRKLEIGNFIFIDKRTGQRWEWKCAGERHEL